MNTKTDAVIAGEFAFADDLGPEKIVHVYDPQTQLKAIVVIDNVAAGPSIGGVRMAADATVSECVRLARAMTLKNAMAGLAHGGGKSVIIADPKLPGEDKTRLVRSFAYAIRDLLDYIPGPDMGTNEEFMAQVKNVIGRAVGLPRELGGIPLDEIGATGFGLGVALEVAQDYLDLRLADARVVVQGFGSVGKHVASFLAQKGARLVGVSDSGGARVCADGFTVEQLIAFKAGGRSVANFPEGASASSDELISVDCDVWIPAARPDAIREDNVAALKAKVVVQGANIPVTEAAEFMLWQRDVLVIPDFVANAGGVICAAVEYHQGNETQAFATIEEKIRGNVSVVLERAAARKQMPRAAALAIAEERVRRAMQFRHTV
jgi:glutamate dehydrogenase/leucine dehydrogenase